MMVVLAGSALRGAAHRRPRRHRAAEVLRGSEGLYLIIYALSVILMMLFMAEGARGPLGPCVALLEIRNLTKHFFASPR